MAAEDHVRWNERYYERALEPYPTPDALLVAYAPTPDPFNPPTALDLAAGLCQNATWLAEQGYQVDAFDISRVGLERGKAEMAMRNLRNVNFRQMDLDAAQLAENAYDLVCVFRYLDRQIFPDLRVAVRAGGLVIYQTFNVRLMQTRTPTTVEYLLDLGELPTFFPGWELLHDEDSGDISRLVARKPV